MNKLILLFILTICASSSFSQLLSSDDIYNKVVLLYQMNEGKSASGSGFLITGGQRFFLVTAKHVADSLQIDFAKICFRTDQGKVLEFPLKAFLKTNSARALNDFSDFFVIELISFDTASNSLLKRSNFEVANLANNKEVPRNFELVTFGYPYVDFEHFTPISFKSAFASNLVNIKINGLKNMCYCYLLEHPGMEGFSGGPVVFGVKDRSNQGANMTGVVGIITGTFYDKTGGKFAIVSPTFQLLDLIK